MFVPAAEAWLSCRRSTATNVAGAILIVLGNLVVLVSVLQLRDARRETAGPPGGLFRRSRNPGLVGMFAFYLGLCLVFGTWVLWVGLPIYLTNMHARVRLEEAHLATKHGKAWQDYAARVPRYL